MSSIPLPALDIRPPQQPDMMGDMSKLMTLRSLMGQQQLQQQQIQEGQLRLQDQQVLRSSAKGLDWTQPDTFSKWITNAQQNGVSPQTLSQLSLQRAQYQEQLAKTDTATLAAEKDRNNQLQGHIDAIKGITDPAKRAQAAQTQASQIISGNLVKDPQMMQHIQAIAQGQVVPSDDDLTMMENGLTDHNTQIEQRLKQAETAKNATEAALNQNKVDVINAWKSNPQQVLAQVDSIVPPQGSNAALNQRTKSQVQFALGNGDVDGAKAAIKQAAEQVGAVEKDVQVAKETQPLKIQTAQVEAQTRFAMEGMAKPVYAYDPKTNTTQLMDQTSALRAGLLPRSVTTKEIQDDVMLNNRLADVHQKIARYEQAMQTPLSSHGPFDTSDSTKMAQILGTDKFKAGAFGSELPVDWMNQIGQKNLIADLSDAAQKRLVAYYNAREAMVGYQRVLSGSGRSSEQAMNLNLGTLANPIAPDSMAKESFKQFRENLNIVGQGLPKIPGVKSPDEWERDMNIGTGGPTTFNVPQSLQKSLSSLLGLGH